MSKRAPVVRVQMVKERSLAYDVAATSPNAVVSALKALLDDQDREQFVVVHLDSKHKIVSLEVVAVGTLNATLVHPREVFKGALLANAAAIVLAHNHPSGNPTPSPEDRLLTEQLLAAGEILGIRVMDHVIIGDPEYCSMRETTGIWSSNPFHR